MIGFLRGKVAMIRPDYCLLDVHGVGYRVFISHETAKNLQLGREIQLYTHMSVREDAIQLYGFYTDDEYALFQRLIGVSGIGPKVAMSILSSITAKDLCVAIQAKQVSRLTKLPGIGKKSAERLILELKDKVRVTDDVENDELELTSETGPDGSIFAEAEEALNSLGYTSAEVAPVLQKARKCQTTEEVIRFALKQLSRA